MNYFEEMMANCYKETSKELVGLIEKTQSEAFEKLYRTNIILAVICVFLTISIVSVSFIGYVQTKRMIDYMNSYDVVTYEQDGDGANNINTGLGDIINGSESDN